jgi:crotonobetainyl-CoA:carnitine CoA-transferase CaiB-like acyl-CoA transferase
VGEGDDAVPSIRNPLTFSATPPRYELPPPALDEHGDELRAWLARPREDSATVGATR